MLFGCICALGLAGCAAEETPTTTDQEAEAAMPEGENEAEAAPAPDRYEISNVRIRKEDPVVGTTPTYYVVFDARWLGDGTPPLVTCSYTVYAEDGSKVERGATRLAVDEGKGLESTVQKEGVVPASAKFAQCPKG